MGSSKKPHLLTLYGPTTMRLTLTNPQPGPNVCSQNKKEKLINKANYISCSFDKHNTKYSMAMTASCSWK